MIDDLFDRALFNAALNCGSAMLFDAAGVQCTIDCMALSMWYDRHYHPHQPPSTRAVLCAWIRAGCPSC